MKILIPGEITETSSSLNHLEKSGKIENVRTFQISSLREQNKPESISQEDDLLSEIVFSDATSWIGPIEDFKDLFPGSQNRDKDFLIPASVETESNRGLIKDLTIDLISFFKPKLVSVGTLEAAKMLDKYKTPTQGLHQIKTVEDKSILTLVKEEILTKEPILIFLHGTFSNFDGSFSGLYKDEVTWKDFTSFYGENIFSFEHYTLTKSPIENARDLLKSLPSDCKIHFVSHSRGGIVGDIICRYFGQGREDGFSEKEIQFLYEQRQSLETNKDYIKKESEKIRELQSLSKKKGDNFSVQKFIRIACPAAGTTLLSKNLNLFFNVINNLVDVGTGGNPITHEIGGAILEIIKQKDKPEILSGLEAMVPNSPLQKILNHPNVETSAPLSIVYSKANYRGGILKGLSYILTKFIFGFKDNDFVVDSKSMFNGVRRKQKIKSLRVKDNHIHHLSYFKNDTLKNTILAELKGEEESSFELKGFYESVRSGNDLPKGKLYPKEISGDRPIVVLIPGIMGSVLSYKNSDVWLNYKKLISNGFDEMDIQNKLDATYLIQSAYGNLAEYLDEKKFDVYCFPYDWRESLSVSARKFKDKLVEILKPNKPVKIIAHSMGGLLVRQVMIDHPAEYKKLKSIPGYKFIMLGTPWKGSHTIIQEMTGHGERVKSINRLTVFYGIKDILKVISKYQGVAQLLPQEWSKKEKWDLLKKESNDKSWPTPDNLDGLNDYFEKWNSFDFDFRNVIYIAGQSTHTTLDVKVDKKKKEKIIFTSTPEGDGSVTWDLGIPDGLEKIYYTKVSHGDLANSEKLFKGLIDILKRGETNDIAFSEERPKIYFTRGGGLMPNDPVFSNDPYELTRNILGFDKLDEYEDEEKPIRLSVTCAHLAKSLFPVMVGHFTDYNLRGAEKAVDNLLDGDLSALLRMGLYPQQANLCRIAETNENDKKFKGGIIVSLGPAEEMTGYLLEKSIEYSVLQYALKRKKEERKKDLLELGVSSVIIGTIYGKLTVETSLEYIIKGVINANQVLKSEKQNVFFNHIEFIEIYEDRHVNIFMNLKDLEHKIKDDYPVYFDNKLVRKDGTRLRLPIDYDSEWYQRYTVTSSEKEQSGNIGKELEFRSNSGLAREEVISSYRRSDLIKSKVQNVSKTKWNKIKSKSLFELLIPNEFKLNFKRQSNILLILDEETAQYPWELLIPDLDIKEPICVKSSMIRQYATKDFVREVRFIESKTALVIGNPDTKRKYNDLPSATVEAKTVNHLLDKNGYDVTLLIEDSHDPDEYTDFINAYEYKIIHIAAHGIFEDDEKFAKIIVGPNENDYLTSAELYEMSYTPELAFINCCHLGKIKNENSDYVRERYKIASSIGVQLIQNGYKAVIVAGWAINDSAANIFAKEFYSEMLKGKNFGNAVKSARRKCYYAYPDRNTWGAYQCYGDPEYKLAKDISKKETQKTYSVPLEPKIDLQDFMNQVKSNKKEREQLVVEIDKISKQIDASPFSTNPEILELRATCYSEILEWKTAIEYYEALFKNGDSRFNFKAYELYCNLIVRHSFKNGDKDEILDTAIPKLKLILEIAGQTAERNNLLGAAYQRLCALEWSIGDQEKMSEYYLEGFKISKKDAVNKYHYPLIIYLKGNYFVEVKLNETVSVNDIKGDELILYLENELKKIQNSDSFWDEVALMTLYQLMLLISEDKKEVNDFVEKMKNIFSLAWEDIGGTYREKSTELEHLQYLLKSLESLDKTINIKLKTERGIIKELKTNNVEVKSDNPHKVAEKYLLNQRKLIPIKTEAIKTFNDYLLNL